MVFDPDQWLKENQQHVNGSDDASKTDLGPDPGWFEDLGRSLVQGWVEDPLTAVGQLVGNAIPAVQRNTPKAVTDFFADEKRRATRTPFQRSVRDAASVFNPLYGLAGPLAKIPALGTPAGSILQPVEHYKDRGDFWRQEAEKLGLAGVTGVGLQRLQGQDKSRKAAQAWEDFDKAKVASSEEEAAKKAAATESLKGATKEWGEQRDQILKEHRDKVKEVNAATVQAGKDAQKAVPRQTSQEWWKRTLEPINEHGSTPNLDWQSGAKVQKIIGERLNKIRQQMNFPLTKIGDLADIRKRTEQWIDSPNVPGFQQLFNQYVLKPLTSSGVPGERPVEMRGQPLADYISGIGAQAQKMLREASRPNNPNASTLYQQSWGLRQIQNYIEQVASEGDPSLRAHLNEAKRAYSYWSIGDAAMQPEYGGVADPADLIRVWKGREGSASRYARTDQDPRNLMMKKWLDDRRAAHQEPSPPTPVSVPPPTIPRPPTATPVRPTAQPTPPTSRRPLGVTPPPQPGKTSGGSNAAASAASVMLPWKWRHIMRVLSKLPSSQRTLEKALQLSRDPMITGSAIGKTAQGSIGNTLGSAVDVAKPALTTLDEILLTLQGQPDGPDQ